MKLRDIALALVVVFCSVSDVHAGSMSSATAEARMPRLMITGYLEAQYEDLVSGTKDNPTHTSGFTELFNLTARGFLVNRRLIHYSIIFDYQKEQGNTSREGDFRSVSLEMSFLPHRPFNAQIRGSYLDGEGYKFTSAGLTLTYTRKVVRPVLIPPKVIESEKPPAEKKSEDEDEEEPKPVPVVPAKVIKVEERGFLYYFLPKIFVFDFDLYSNTFSLGSDTFSLGSDTVSYDARLHMRGDYGSTIYFVTLEDLYTREDNKGSSENVFFSDLSTVTGLKNAILRTKAYFDAGNMTSYGLTTDMEGKLPREWDYTLNASYLSTVSSINTTTYGVTADARSKATARGTRLDYRLGAGYQHEEADLDISSNAFVRGALNTSTPLSRTLSLGTDSALSLGTGSSPYSSRILGNYRPWERFYLFVSYSIRGAFGNSSFNDSFNPVINSYAATAEDQKGPVHAAQAGMQFYLIGVNFGGNGTFEMSPSTETQGVFATASAYLFNRVNVALGGSLSWSKPRKEEGLNAGKTTSYNIYNVVTMPFLFRNSSFLIMSTYTRSDSIDLFSGQPATSSFLTFNPVFRWMWRRLSIEIDGKYTMTQENNNAERIERRILVRVRRPFRAL